MGTLRDRQGPWGPTHSLGNNPGTLGTNDRPSGNPMSQHNTLGTDVTPWGHREHRSGPLGTEEDVGDKRGMDRDPSGNLVTQ